MRVLLVEDEESIARFVSIGLREENYTVDIASDGEDGLHLAITEPYDMIILDVNLPKLTGFEICLDVRRNHIDTPILMLTSNSEVKDKVYGLDIGADDYLTKPFAFEELLARIRSLLRRKSKVIQEMKISELLIKRNSHRVFIGDNEIVLRPKEFAILEFLVRKKECVVSRTQIIENVWGHDFDPATNLVDVHIRTIRNKISRYTSEDYIHTVRGMGYIVKSS